MDKDLITAASPDKWGEIGGPVGLFIWALFILIAVMIWLLERRLNHVISGIADVSKEIAQLGAQVDKAQTIITAMLYDAGALENRRRRNTDYSPKRRKSDDDAY